MSDQRDHDEYYGYDDDDERDYWESAEEYDPEPEDMTDEDWAYYFRVVAT